VIIAWLPRRGGPPRAVPVAVREGTFWARFAGRDLRAGTLQARYLGSDVYQPLTIQVQVAAPLSSRR